MIPDSHLRCVNRFLMHGLRSGKGLVDRGYRGELIENIKRDFNIDIEVSSTPNGTNGFTPKPLRWVVERTFALAGRIPQAYTKL